MSSRLTAMDVESQDFPRKVRGYDPEQVRMYLKSVAEEIQRLNLETDEMRERALRLQVQIDEIRAREKALQDTLVSAQRMAEEMKERARHEAELTVREARLKAERLLEQAQDQLARIEDETRRCRLERDAFENRLRTVIEEHLAMLEMRKADRTDGESLRYLHRKTGSEAG